MTTNGPSFFSLSHTRCLYCGRRGGEGRNHSGLGCWRCFPRWRTKKYTLTEWAGPAGPLNTDQWNVTIGPYCLYCLHREIVKPTKMLSFLLSDCSNIVHSIISSLAAACRSCSGKAGGGGGPTYQPYAWFLNTVFSYQEIYYISATTWPNFSQDLQHFLTIKPTIYIAIVDWDKATIVKRAPSS